MSELIGDVSADVVTDRVSVPAGLTQQPLQPVRALMPGVFSQPPAVLPADPGQQPDDQRFRGRPWLDPGEPARHSPHQLIQARHPPVGLYAVARSHREIVLSRHKPEIIKRWLPRLQDRHAQDHDLRLEY